MSGGYGKGFDQSYVAKIAEVAVAQESEKEESNVVGEDSTQQSRFSCQLFPAATSSLVHALRPEHIEILAAIGDSLTVN